MGDHTRSTGGVMERNINVLAAFLGLLLGALCVSAASAQVDIGPFVEQDGFTDIKLSPTGEYYAAAVPVGDQTGLAVLRREDGSIATSFRFPSGTHVHNFWWVNDERVLVSVAESFGSRDDPQPTGELYATNADGSQQELLVGWRVQNWQTGTNIRSRRREEFVAASLIDPLPGDDRHVLISVHPIRPDPMTRVERMDVYTGRRTRVTGAPVPRARFVTDNRGVVRFAIGADASNNSRLYYRPAATGDWEMVNDEAQSRRMEIPIGFSDDDATAYLQVEHHEGPDSIVALDVATRERQELLRDDVVDPWPVYRDGWGAPIGVRFMGAVPRIAFFDEASADARLYRSLEAAFPGHNVSIPSATSDGRHKLVLVSGDRDPGSFYIFDTEDLSADFILARREQVDPDRMARMRAISFASRDGLEIHGFLTVPNESDGRGLPLVLLPHGGPYGIFDRWGFDIDSQVLAAAGYAVLKVNFRGSGNYGRRFQQLGAQQWGLAMQDDLTDATRWAIDSGIADPERICIYGASYGGYAALMGVAKEPDLYRCAVGYVGVYDLPMMRGENRRIGRSAVTWTSEWVGSDNARLAQVSPNRIADSITVPVFLAAGGRDEVAPIQHSRLMERALVRAGAEVETLYIPSEGHGFYRAQHQRQFYERLLAFLGQHIGGQVASGAP